jgi:hypothetical protein
VEADRSQKVDVVSNDTQTVNVEPSKRLKMDELHQDKVTQTNVAKERKMVTIIISYALEHYIKQIYFSSFLFISFQTLPLYVTFN